MLDLRFIREHPEDVRKGIALRGLRIDLDRLLELDRQALAARQERDDTASEQNRLSKSVPALKGEEKAKAIERSKELGRKLKPLDERISALEAEMRPLHLEIPNLPDPEVPPGLTAAENHEVRRWGEPRAFDFEPKDHLALAERMKLVDMERATRIAGTRTYVLKGDLVLLELAVLRFALDLVSSRGYVPHAPPLLVKREAMEGTGYLPLGADQAYECTRDDGWLIGTSEVPVTALHGGEILDEAQLPLRYAGYSACFRREAGTHGKDTHGLYRVHQFMKVEQVVVCRHDADESRRFHEEILGNAEDVLQALELPYRVVALCAGDLGRSQSFTYDIETWMPGRGDYGETHSASRYYDYQARRLNLRYRGGDGKVRFCHTLNNTVIASPRILVAILENGQQSDGSVRVPDVLVPFVGREFLTP
ncbi:MAG TPA: serine--tRNA ligase [Planctomycetota bacterium]|nr:serine--tRNA ligase [Planctomycetota bacterium]